MLSSTTFLLKVAHYLLDYMISPSHVEEHEKAWLQENFVPKKIP